jgi:hypothetical protein
MTRLRFSLALVGLLFSQGVLAKFPCAMVAETRDASVLVEGQSYTLPLRLPNCEGAQVSKGSVVVCFSRKGGEKACKSFLAGDKLLAATVAANSEQKSSDFGFIALLKGDAQVRTGQTRNNRSVVGMPYGEMLALDPIASFTINDKRIEFPVDIVITSDDTAQSVVASKKLADGDAIDIPVDKLRSGSAFVWSINGAGGSIKGRFSIAHHSTQEEIRDKLSQIAGDKELSDIAKAMLQAELFNDYGYAFDRDKALSRLNR